eukprot:GFYU01004724.1.p1 GENE.GFYU01004724.1~~GFYU01004724.1.p1  ORF type:complete len:187 (-),score=45.81 GFYU01004724.1:23-583(-)
MVTLRCKTIVVGNATVGKSALTQVFTNRKQYPKTYVMTVGVDFSVKVVNIPDSSDSVELYLFDTAGQYLYKELAPQYWDHSSCVMLVYDVTNAESFQACEEWMEMVKRANRDKVLPGVLVANKMDLDDRIEVKRQQGVEFARAHGLEFFECSAQRGTDVDAPFNYLANGFHKSYKEKLEGFKNTFK